MLWEKLTGRLLLCHLMVELLVILMLVTSDSFFILADDWEKSGSMWSAGMLRISGALILLALGNPVVRV